MNKVTKEQAAKAIRTICGVAKINVVVTEEIEEGLTPQLETTATALQKNYGLDTAVMEEYRDSIEEVKKSGTADEIPYADAENARDTVYKMCEELTDAKEIMQHVYNMREILYILAPHGYLRLTKE